MTLPKTLAPKPKAVTINNQSYNLVAFYYPDYDTGWDLAFQGQFLANFYRCNFSLTINGITASFNTAEAAFQATKCWNTTEREMFEAAQCDTGTQAFNNKKKIASPDTSYAGLGRDGAMKAVLTAKFSDPVLRQGLIATGDAYLLEHNERKGRDDYWSDDHDGLKKHDPLGKTLNMLGKTLMEVREECGGVGAPKGQYTVADFTSHAEK